MGRKIRDNSNSMINKIYFKKNFVYTEEEDPVYFNKRSFLRKVLKSRVSEMRTIIETEVIQIVTPCLFFFPHASVQASQIQLALLPNYIPAVSHHVYWYHHVHWEFREEVHLRYIFEKLQCVGGFKVMSLNLINQGRI